MKITRRSNALLLGTVLGFTASSTPLLSAEANNPPTSIPAQPSIQQKLKALWSDNPEHAAAYAQSTFTKRPEPVTQAPPVPPPFLTPEMKVSTGVAFIVDETGAVIAARVLESTDPRFNQAAIDSVLKWTFTPAENNGQPVKSFLYIQVNFDGGLPEEQLAIRFQVNAPTYDVRGRHLHVPIEIAGPGSSHVRGARFRLIRATDDTGAELTSPLAPSFFRAAVGSSSPEDYVRTPVPSLSVDLSNLAADAKFIRNLEGAVEFIFPFADPGSTVRLHGIIDQLGIILQTPALKEAGISLIVYDRENAETGRVLPDGSGGPQDFDSGPLFGKPPAGIPPGMWGQLEGLTQNELAIGVSDPEGRLVGMEFQTYEGDSVRYNHNGRYHSGASPGKRMAVYRFTSKPTRDLQLVCWLVTSKSLLKAPLKLENLALPTPPHAPQSTAPTP